MRYVFPILLLISLAFAPVFAAPTSDWSDIIKKVEKALVYIETDDSSCTGFVVNISKKYVQTAAHCDGEKMFVDMVTAKVVSKDTQRDLMILVVPDLDPARTELKAAKHNPDMGEEVMSAGFGYSLERPFFRKSMISDNAVVIPNVSGGPYIGVDSGYIGGQSGGPVVDSNGDVVSIVQRASDKLGIGVGIETIKIRMGRFWTPAE